MENQGGGKHGHIGNRWGNYLFLNEYKNNSSVYPV